MALTSFTVVELRARTRTFDGAYGRSAISNLGYALTILRLFDKRFFKSEHFCPSLSLSPPFLALCPLNTTFLCTPPHLVGVLYAALAGLLSVLAHFRQRHSRHDFADKNRAPAYGGAVKTVGQTGKRVFGRPFVTAGWIVALLSFVVLATEIGLLVLIFEI